MYKKTIWLRTRELVVKPSDGECCVYATCVCCMQEVLLLSLRVLGIEFTQDSFAEFIIDNPTAPPWEARLGRIKPIRYFEERFQLLHDSVRKTTRNPEWPELHEIRRPGRLVSSWLSLDENKGRNAKMKQGFVIPRHDAPIECWGTGEISRQEFESKIGVDF